MENADIEKPNKPAPQRGLRERRFSTVAHNPVDNYKSLGITLGKKSPHHVPSGAWCGRSIYGWNRAFLTTLIFPSLGSSGP